MTHSVFQRSAGVLLPLASLNGRHGVGDLGPAAHEFVRWCGEAGFSWWQMLPIGPLGPGDSPYSSTSAFASEPLYLSLEALADEGLLAANDLETTSVDAYGEVAYHDARSFKQPLLRKAFETWQAQRAARDAGFERFCETNATWLDAYAETYADPLFARFLQQRFDLQWSALRETATLSGLKLMGDVPIFVGAESVDVATRPELFRLDSRGEPTVVSGVPPDALAPEGQRWGHPHYAWEAHRAEGFAWWRARVRRLLDYFDAARIDHFVGFYHAYEIPMDSPGASGGSWGRTPGKELLDALHSELGALPFVAEDLGETTPGMHALREAHALPGMSILQWGFGQDSSHAPDEITHNSVVYPGTHDMDTVRGWWRDLDAPTRARVLAHTGGDSETVAWDIWRAACGTSAHTAITPVQDLLNLGRPARTNVPGTTTGNWRWRPAQRSFTSPLARRVRELIEATHRLPIR
jgi:4-alpha-glucanotransferase